MKLHRLGSISFQAIYHFIHTHALQWDTDLKRYLRHKGKKPKAGKGKEKRGIVPNRRDIDERPEIVATKERFRNWETDTIIAKLLGCDIFFVKPYAAWKKGLIEHNNGLFGTVSQAQIKACISNLNGPP